MGVLTVQPRNEITDSKVQIDPSGHYNEQLVVMTNQIDKLKQDMVFDKSVILQLSERIQALYVYLYPKMLNQERKTQTIYIGLLNGLKIFSNKKRESRSGGMEEVKVLNDKDYKACRATLEQRELKLNEVRERLGLTARQKEGGRVR